MDHKSSPLQIQNVEKMEYHNHNHVDTDTITFLLKKTLRAVERDTAAEEALASQNEELRQQLEELLTGDVLPPVVQDKIRAMIAKIKSGKDSLAQAIAETTPPAT